MFYKRFFWKFSRKISGKHASRSLFFNKVARCKRDSGKGAFLWSFAKFLKTCFLYSAFGWLLLQKRCTFYIYSTNDDSHCIFFVFSADHFAFSNNYFNNMVRINLSNFEQHIWLKRSSIFFIELSYKIG